MTEFFFFRHFPGPVGAMYQSVGKWFRMHLRADSIYKISGGRPDPSPIFRGFACASAHTLTFKAG